MAQPSGPGAPPGRPGVFIDIVDWGVADGRVIYALRIKLSTFIWTLYRRFTEFRTLGESVSAANSTPSIRLGVSSDEQVTSVSSWPQPTCSPIHALHHMLSSFGPGSGRQSRPALPTRTAKLLTKHAKTSEGFFSAGFASTEFHSFLRSNANSPPRGLRLMGSARQRQAAMAAQQQQQMAAAQQQHQAALARQHAAAATAAAPAGAAALMTTRPAPSGSVRGMPAFTVQQQRPPAAAAAAVGHAAGAGSVADAARSMSGLHISAPSTAGAAAPASAQDPSPTAGLRSSRSKIGLGNFMLLKVVGKGSFGKVMMVRKKDNGRIYAMKVLLKSNVIKRNQIEHTQTERSVLGKIDHPFIVGLNYAFQTPDKLYFVLDYCAGGELFFHLGRHGPFDEGRSRFYAAQIVLALEHLHQLGIIYRDLKPENVLLDQHGNVRLTDFGLSKEGVNEGASGAHSFCGTPEYLAPEVLDRVGHGRAVDWWSLGALLYEMLTGLPPFFCKDRAELFRKIRTGDLDLSSSAISPQAKDLLARLLDRSPSTRLGCGTDDAQELKRHPFFAGVDWQSLFERRITPPWVPPVRSSFDTSQFDQEFTSMPLVSPTQRTDARFQVQFPNFTFVKPATLAGGASIARGRAGSTQGPSSLLVGSTGSVLHSVAAMSHAMPAPAVAAAGGGGLA